MMIEIEVFEQYELSWPHWQYDIVNCPNTDVSDCVEIEDNPSLRESWQLSSRLLMISSRSRMST